MTQADMLSINTVAAKLGLSVHQLRRWELMFGLEIKRGRGQQRQYRSEDLSVLERIKELVEQGWPTTQIRPQLEAEGLITPKLIGMPQQPGNPEMLMEAVIGLRSFTERRFIEISKQIDELRQLMISITLRNELRNEISSPWQPVEEEFAPAVTAPPAQEISIGPAINVSVPSSPEFAAGAKNKPLPAPPPPVAPPPAPPPPSSALLPAASSAAPESASAETAVEEQATPASLPASPGPEGQDAAAEAIEEDFFAGDESSLDFEAVSEATADSTEAPVMEPALPLEPKMPPLPPPAAELTTQASTHSVASSLGEITDQNYLTVLGKALDMIGWTDEQADQYSQKEFGVAHWDELGRSQTEKLIDHLVGLMT